MLNINSVYKLRRLVTFAVNKFHKFAGAVMANTKAVETNTQAVSPVSIFGGGAGAAAASGAPAAGAAGAAGGGAGACAPALCTNRAVPPANMARQRRTGRIFFILRICDSIIASFHPMNCSTRLPWLSHATPSTALRTDFFVEADCALRALPRACEGLACPHRQVAAAPFRHRLRGMLHGGASTELSIRSHASQYTGLRSPSAQNR